MQRSPSSKFFCIVLFVAMTAYTAWSWFFQTGLYATLIRFQSDRYDVYYPLITGVVMWIVLAVTPLAYAYGGKGIHEFQLTPKQLKRKLRFRMLRLFLGFSVTAALAFTAYYYSPDVPHDDQATIDIDVSEPVAGPMWFKRVNLNGRSLDDSRVLTEKNVSDEGITTFTRYIPIAPAKGSMQPVQFVESLTSDSLERINRDPVAMSGYVLPMSVPVRVKDSFKHDGVRLAKRVYIVSNNGFSAQTTLYIASAILGLLSFAILITLIAAPWHNRKKLQDSQDHQARW